MIPPYMPALDHAAWSDLHRRPWAMTGREYAALARLSTLQGEWMRLTQRDLARHLGYSLAGVAGFLASMRAAGLLAIRTRRGRKGGTWVRAARGLLAALARNVRPVESTRRKEVIEPLYVSEQIPPLTWAELGRVLRQGARVTAP